MSTQTNLLKRKRYWEIGEYRHLQAEFIEFMRTVLNTDQVPFEIRVKRWGKTATRISVADRRWRSLAGFYRHVWRFMYLYIPERFYSADLELFFACFREFELFRRCGWADPNHRIGDQLIEGEAYNEFIAYLRREAKLRNVRKKVADWRGSLKKQAASIREYIAALSMAYRLLLIMRIDLYYAEQAGEDNNALERLDWNLDEHGVWTHTPSRMAFGHGIAETAGRIDTATAMRHRDRFFDNRRGSDKELFRHMVGYLAKMETGGRCRSNHFHCFLFFDGTAAGDIDALVNRARDRWHRTTNGTGLVYDSRNRLDKYQLKAEGKWAIDPLKRGDAVALARLQDYAAGYAAKDDGQMVCVKPAPKACTLTKGDFPVSGAAGHDLSTLLSA